mmetsp:Transcript_25114/g.62820  ORF Transcript_25114/g.62820 Transcript_25114/m.62820 type:complete len:243 (+) Transcript_25114:88-816(+)
MQVYVLGAETHEGTQQDPTMASLDLLELGSRASEGCRRSSFFIRSLLFLALLFGFLGLLLVLLRLLRNLGLLGPLRLLRFLGLLGLGLIFHLVLNAVQRVSFILDYLVGRLLQSVHCCRLGFLSFDTRRCPTTDNLFGASRPRHLCRGGSTIARFLGSLRIFLLVRFLERRDLFLLRHFFGNLVDNKSHAIRNRPRRFTDHHIARVDVRILRHVDGLAAEHSDFVNDDSVHHLSGTANRPVS